MKKVFSLIASLFLLPNIIIADTNIEAAVQDLCKCGFPPSSACMDGMAKKYPEIDKNTALQNQVMDRYQRECGMGSRMGSGALKSINKVVSSTPDCSTPSFKVIIPKNWQCRKQNNNAQDVTLYTNNNRLNVTVGINQGQTSCSVIPICTSEKTILSNQFESMLFKNPMAKTFEYSGFYKKDNMFKLTITSNTKPSTKQLDGIKAILDSFETR